MALADHKDLEVKLGVTLTSEEQTRADELLNQSSALVMEESGGVAEDKAPVLASVIAVEIAARVWINPSSLQSESLGSASASFGSEVGLMLTDRERSRLRRAFRKGSSTYSTRLR